MPTIKPPPQLLICNHCKHEWTADKRVDRRSAIRLPWPACPRCGVQDQKVLCGGKTKNGPCRREPHLGHDGGRCRKLHRGAARKGIAHPNFTLQPKESSSVQFRYREAIARATADPELLSARPIVATLTARVQELRERVEAAEGETGAAWRTAKAAGDRLEAALGANPPNPAKVAKELGALLGVLRAGDTVENQWAEYARAAEWWRRAGAYEVERKRVEAGMLPIEVVYGMMTLMVQAARELFGDGASELGSRLSDLVGHRMPALRELDPGAPN